MVQPIQRIWNPNTQQWEQIAPTKEEFDNLVDSVGTDVSTHKSSIASQNQLGHVKIGSGINIDAEGKISAQEVDLSNYAQKNGTYSDLRAQGTTKGDVGLGNVDNVKQMPIAGGTFTGIATAQSNTSYTTKQIRNITLSTNNPSGGGNGDIWIKYE